mgnify:FL=1|jgi:hypothetical protein|tara:strand:- start:205 stop:327 length:123 start_codon:yes stop_codon:yes gene_type:complete
MLVGAKALGGLEHKKFCLVSMQSALIDSLLGRGDIYFDLL